MLSVTVTSRVSRRAWFIVLGGLLVIASQAVRADLMPPASPGGIPASPLLQFEAPGSNASVVGGLGPVAGPTPMDVVSRGRWTAACRMAINSLARRRPDVEALGVFALCAAIRNERDVVKSALARLREVEGGSGYYGLLTEGVVALHDRVPEKAEGAFRAVLETRPDDPLASYFSGEALHARHKDADAIMTFKAVLKTWPEYAPAWAGAAQLMASEQATGDDLKAAIVLMEGAVKADPSNLAYWRMLASLCQRTGQTDRANAITVQWLSGPPRIR